MTVVEFKPVRKFVVEMKKIRFSDGEIEVIRESVRRGLKSNEISEFLTKTTGIYRSTDSVRAKMMKLGISYERKIAPKPLTREQLAAKQRAKALSLEDRLHLLGTSRHYTDRFLNAIKLSGARMMEFKGQKTWSIDGKPVSVFEILKYAFE